MAAVGAQEFAPDTRDVGDLAAGRLLDKALVTAHVDRDRVYITNAVKHFNFTRAELGKRRVHKTPSRTEVVACRSWLIAECRLLG